MEKGKIIKGKSGVAFYEYSSWCHRYKTLESNGKVKYNKIKGFKTEEEAVESYDKYKELFEEQLREYYITVNKDIMFKDYIIHWYKNIYSERVTDNTKLVGAYIVYDLILSNVEYDLKINMVTTSYLDEIIEKASKLTDSGGYSARAIIKIAMKDAVTGGYITYNPSLDTKVYKRPKKKIRVLSEKQIRKLLAAAKKTNWYLEILLGLFLGLRKGEILGLKFNDFDLEKKTVKIERQIVREGEILDENSKITNYKLVERPPKTSNSIRCLRVPNLIFDEIKKREQIVSNNKESIEDEYEDHDYISCRDDGKCHALNSMNNALSKICKEICLPHITVHGLRHMCATILLEEGVSLAKISAMLGHTSIHTTFEYYCEVMDEKEKILEFMNNIFSVQDSEDE